MKNENAQNAYPKPQEFTKSKLSEENEILKTKLATEFGMKEFGSCLDESAENEWLNYIYNFEKQYKEAGTIKVSERLGNPVFRKEEDLTDKEIKEELERSFDLMEQNGINIDFICEYEERVMYKFITEELFEHEIEDMNIPGMRTCFIYEEFHPNHEYDIKKTVEEFFNFFLKKEFHEESYKFVFLDDSIQYKEIKHSKDEFLKKLIEFREILKPFSVDLLEFYKVEFDLESRNGSADGELTYSVSDNEGHAHVSCEFKIKLKMNDCGFWEISEVWVRLFRSQ